MTQETYPMPKDGWVCFHCGERFTTPGGARIHFGARPTAMAGCLIKVGEERGLLMEIRRLEAALAELIDNTCSICDQTFLSKRALASHKCSAHGVSVERREDREMIDMDKPCKAEEAKHWQCSPKDPCQRHGCKPERCRC